MGWCWAIKRMHLLLPILEVTKTVPGTLDTLPEIAREIIFPFEFSLGINFLSELDAYVLIWISGEQAELGEGFFWAVRQLLGALQWGFCAFLCPRHGSILSRESPADKKQKVERCSSTHDFDPTGKVLKSKKKTPTKALGSRIKMILMCHKCGFQSCGVLQRQCGHRNECGLDFKHPHNQHGLVYQ